MNVLSQIRALLNDSNIVLEEDVQSLWSGYGKIIRCKNTQNNQHYIVKVIAPHSPGDHPRGWNTSASHERKIKSYQVEANFYQHFSQQANSPLTLSNTILSGSTLNNMPDEVFCRVPKLIASNVEEDFTLLVMEDLDNSGFGIRKAKGDWASLQLAIKWLAYFHAKFMGNSSQHLWATGTYWHLGTRQDEYNAMPDSEFKTHAQLIDSALNSAEFQTFVHGDAKFENLCFHFNEQSVAAVDFQYIGRGSGVKDLAYLVGSCLDEEQLFTFDERILEEYLTQLKQALIANNINLDFTALAEETIKLYPVAWADFYRFLLGWNPQSWKICDYLKQKSQMGLNTLLIDK